MNTDKIKKVSFFIGGLILIFSFSAYLVSKNIKDPKLFAPVIVFSEEKKDFGDIKEGPQLEGIFEFTNTGENELLIKNVTASCGCTSAMVDEKKNFGPGEHGRIKFTFNTQGRSGHNEKNITVESNDPKSPRKVLTISCNIVPAN